MELKSSVNLGLVREKATELLDNFKGRTSEAYLAKFEVGENAYDYFAVSVRLPATVSEVNQFGILRTSVTELQITITPTIGVSSSHLHGIFHDDTNFNIVLTKINGNGGVEYVSFCQDCYISEMNAPSFDMREEDVELTIKMRYYAIM